MGRTAVRARTVASAALVLLAAALLVGSLAQEDKLNGYAALSDGEPALALSRASDALALFPQLEDDPVTEATIGDADLALGRATGAAYYAEALVQPESTAQDVEREFSLLERALALSPGNTLVREQLTQSVVIAANRGYVGLLHDLPSGASVLVTTAAIGHAYYVQRDYAAAIQCFQAVLPSTANGEMRSYELTYMALAYDHLGELTAFRHFIVEAVAADGADRNALARDAATGLFTQPGA